MEIVNNQSSVPTPDPNADGLLDDGDPVTVRVAIRRFDHDVVQVLAA